MVRHVLVLKLKDGSEEAKRANARRVKQVLEALVGVIDGLKSLNVIIDPLSTSSRDIMLDSLFEDEAALAAYQVHPAHQEAAGFVRSVVQERACIDYKE